ncbi:MAG: hypothetical protein AB7G23_21530 [Vicinamibacterales bacterium]
MPQARSDKAAALADEAGQWLKVRDRATGRPLCYGIRSESDPGHYHAVTRTSCCCRWAQTRSAGQLDRDPCSHILAVRIHVRRVQARRRPTAAPATRRAA